MVTFGRAIAYTLVHMIGSFTFGFITIFPNPGVRSMREEWPFFNDVVNSDSVRYFSSFTPLFASLGGFFIHFLIRYITNNRRRIVISILNVFGAIIWLLFLIITPYRWWIGIFLRSLQGLVLGGNATITPIIILEIAPKRSKGMFGGLAQIGKTSGFLIYYIIATYSNWRLLVVVGAVFCLIHSIFIWFTPEQSEINGFSMSGIDQEIAILNSNFHNRNRRRSVKRKCNDCIHSSYESVFQRKYAFKLFTGMMMMFFQQFCGINALNANLVQVMDRSGLHLHPNIKSAISTTAQWLAVFISSFILDACGRKSIWILSATGTTIGLAMYIASMKIEIGGWFPALCVFLIMMFFGVGFGPIPWFIGYDMFPQDVRMMGQSMINFSAMISTFAIAFIHPIMSEKLGEYYVCIIYSSITFVAIIFGILCVKDPEEIDTSITVL